MNRLHWIVIAALAGSLPCSRAAISVKATGTGSLGFETTPEATEFSTGVLPGGIGTFLTTNQVDAAVATVAATNIVSRLTTTGTFPPNVHALGFRHNINPTAGFFLQSRPSAGGAHVLLATLQNDSGAPLHAFHLFYDFNLYDPAIRDLPGFRVYYSGNGEPGSWQFIPELSGMETTGRVAALVVPAAPRGAGERFFLLWVDVNASSEPAYTIDNLYVIPADGSPWIVSNPQSMEVNPGSTVEFSVEAVGLPPLSYKWRRDGVDLPGRTSSSLILTNAQVSDRGIYDVTVANGIDAATSHGAILSVGFRLATSATGGGEVQVQPAGGFHTPGQVVMLTAIPNSNREFRHWSGNVNASANPLSLTMSSNIAVTANFGPLSALLEVTIEGVGIVARSPDKARYDVGEAVVLSANQSDWWYAFSHWTDGNSENPRTITIGLTNRYTASYLPTTALETVTYDGLSRTAPVGMPALLVDGEFAIDQLFYKESPARIEMFTTFSSGSIFYTLNGSKPTQSSTRYQGPFEVQSDVNIWPVAFDSEQANSVEGYPFEVIFPPRVLLQMRRMPGALLFFWPDHSAEYSLEATSAIGPAAVWASFEGPVIVSDGWITATAPISGDLRFFRLRKP